MSTSAGQASDRVGLVLVVEDDPTAAEAIAGAVRAVGYAARVAGSIEEARRIVADGPPDLALVDQTLPDGEGTALARELAGRGVPDLVMISGAGSRDVVVEALRAGVNDFLAKPVRLSRVRRVVLGSRALARRGPDVAAVPATTVEVRPAGLVGRSRASRELRERVERLARVPGLRALIVGPPGTDKRRVAARLHVESGAPGAALFVDCSHEIDRAAAVRFFGRPGDEARGTCAVHGYVARARDGTLVLDDLSLLPRDLQSVLCTALFASSPSPDGASGHGSGDGAGPEAPGASEPPGIDAAGTGAETRDDGTGGEESAVRTTELRCGVVGILREPTRVAVATGRLSADLHLALSGAIVEVPSLDERREDIDEIAEHFLAELNESERGDKRLAEDFEVEAAERPWPGNLLQLRNTLRTAYARAEPRGPVSLGRNAVGSADAPEVPVDTLVGLSFEDVRRELLLATLAHAGGDKRLCAELLGISLKSVYAHLERSARSRRHAARAERAARPVKRAPDRRGPLA